MSEIKQFKDPNGYVFALAAIPDNYLIGSSLVNKMQSESVPFTVTAHAIDGQRGIAIYGLSDEMFTTYKNQFIKATLKSVPGVIWTSVRDFIQPEEYLKQFAEAVSQMKLVPVAQAALPSIFGSNIQKSYEDFMAQYRAAFAREESLGTPTYPNNSLCKALLVRYIGRKADGTDYVVLAGMDYKGIEYYSGTSPLSAISPLAGLLGGMMKTRQAEKSSDKLGEGKPCDAIDWGAQNRFAMIAPAAYEQEATKDFLAFVSTFHMEDSVRAQFFQRQADRVMERMQMTMQFQQMAQQSMINLQRNQQQLAQTLARNSAEMSAGIMDSWNRKMASDSRISQARSEAIRGVDVYTNSYGQNIDVSVTADHVYQDQYGDVYDVSGIAPDQELLNRLNWTELKK